MAFTSLIFGGYIALTASWGLFGFIAGFLIPICRFYFWLTTFTMLHHLNPEKPFLSEMDWRKYSGATQLLGTINVRYGRYTDLLTHNIAWHVPHHVSVAIPHYHLKGANQALKQAYPAFINEEIFSWQYLRSILHNCQTIHSEDDLRWKKFAKVKYGSLNSRSLSEISKPENIA